MRLAVSLALLSTGVHAFAPQQQQFHTPGTTFLAPPSTSSTAHRALPSDFVDAFGDLQQQLSNLPWSSTLSLADGVEAVQDVAAATGGDDNGWFGFLTGPTQGLLEVIHSVLVSVGVDANAWGISIIVLTMLIKVATFPLTKSQLESTSKMQAMSPAIKEIQAKYQSNPEVMNQKIAEFYQVNEINPLAGCLPSLVQIPVFIGLYRAVLTLAKEDKLDEPFLFLPSLEGPTYGADPASGADWIFKWVDGAPSLGWDDTISFLILPVFLVVSQFISMELMQPKSDDPAQQQSNAILKVLPVLIGWFALNVPSALSVYWVVNNIVTTATSVVIRNSLKFEPATAGSSSGGAATLEPPTTIFAPPREKPAGFGAGPAMARPSIDGITPITAIDVESVVESDDGDEGEEVTGEAVSEETNQPSRKEKRRRKRGKKKRKN